MDMKIKNILSFVLVSVLGLISCSKDNVNSDMGGGQEETKFKKLASVNIGAAEGNKEEMPESRTAGSINDAGKPTKIYYENFVNLLSLDVTDNISENNINECINYSFEKYDYGTHNFKNYSYDLYYHIKEESKNATGSNSGIITLSTSPNPDDENQIDVRLTVFKKEDLENLKLVEFEDMIYKLHNFDFSVDKPMGTVLYYLNYNPFDNNSVFLPELNETEVINKYSFLKDYEEQKLYNESESEYFVSKELLIAATDEKVYVLETQKNVIEQERGYKLLRMYEREKTEDQDVSRMKIDMSRLTTLINASLIINDTYPDENNSENSYFVDGDITESENRFLEKFEVNLKGMECYYATIDGIQNVYHINSLKDNNTEGNERMVLWAKDNKVIGIDGKEYDKLPTYGKVNMIEGERAFSGLGFKGNSYSVGFKGYIENGSQLRFYTTIAGVNLIIYTKMKGFILEQNVLYQLTLLVKAESLKKAIEDILSKPAPEASRTNGNGFIEIEVPSENLIIN